MRMLLRDRAGVMKRYQAIAEYYDFEFAVGRAAEILRHDVPFFLDHLPARSQRVLELAAGTGRAALPIAQAGHRVAALDYDQALLDIAARKRDAAGLGEKQLALVHGDIRRLSPANPGGTFDWICIFFNTFLGFPTLEEQDQLLSGVRELLRPRGRFWLDIFQPDLAVLPRGRETGLDPVAFFVPALNRTVFRTTELRRDPLHQVQVVTFHYLWHGPRGEPHRQRTTFEMTFMFPRELRLLLERNGLKIERLYGNYDGSELTADSPRIIAQVKRA